MCWADKMYQISNMPMSVKKGLPVEGIKEVLKDGNEIQWSHVGLALSSLQEGLSRLSSPVSCSHSILNFLVITFVTLPHNWFLPVLFIGLQAL
jgi:hypothetical protein